MRLIRWWRTRKFTREGMYRAHLRAFAQAHPPTLALPPIRLRKAEPDRRAMLRALKRVG